MLVCKTLLCLILATCLYKSAGAYPEVKKLPSKTEQSEKITVDEVTSNRTTFVEKVKMALGPFTHNGAVRIPTQSYFHDPTQLGPFSLTLFQGSANQTTISCTDTDVFGLSNATMTVIDTRPLTYDDDVQAYYMQMYLPVRQLSVLANCTAEDASSHTAPCNFTMSRATFTAGVKLAPPDRAEAAHRRTTAFLDLDDDYSLSVDCEHSITNFKDFRTTVAVQLQRQFGHFVQNFADTVLERMPANTGYIQHTTREKTICPLRGSPPDDEIQSEDSEVITEEETNSDALNATSLSDKIKPVLQPHTKNELVEFPSETLVEDKLFPSSAKYKLDNPQLKIHIRSHMRYTGLRNVIVKVPHVDSYNDDKALVHLYLTSEPGVIIRYMVNHCELKGVNCSVDPEEGWFNKTTPYANGRAAVEISRQGSKYTRKLSYKRIEFLYGYSDRDVKLNVNDETTVNLDMAWTTKQHLIQDSVKKFIRDFTNGFMQKIRRK